MLHLAKLAVSRISNHAWNKVLISVHSRTTTTGDADGARKGLPNGTKPPSAEAKVSSLPDNFNFKADLFDRYDEEIQRLHRELEARGGPPSAARIGGPPQHAGPAQAPPPSIGHGPSNLFGGIMAGQGGQGAPGLAPPPEQGQQGPPQHQMPQPPPGLQQGPPPSQGPFQQGGYGQTSAPNGYPGQPPQPTASPGGKPRVTNRGPGGPATPQLNQHVQYPDPRVSPQVGMPSSAHRHSQIANVGNALAELDLERLPDHQKKAVGDWFAIFNPQVPRVLDVDLLHTLPHESVVCCVRFSHDGKYVATGCNRSAQIFDVMTGQKVCILQDETVDNVGDLYIRSVCFSPDGKYLATGAEDKLIRVCSMVFTFPNLTNLTLRYGTSNQDRSGTPSLVTNKTSTLWILPKTVAQLHLEVVIELSVFGTSTRIRASCL